LSLRSLLFHDVALPESLASTGFSSPGADVYKVHPDVFDRYLRKIQAAEVGLPARIDRPVDSALRAGWAMTFDDGGVSAATEIAPRLKALGWTGHFFIPTAYIGRSGFMDGEQLRRLRDAGHIVGTHTRTHPRRISALKYGQIIDEWRASRDELSNIIGEPVRTASVPGGFYSGRVAAAAREAGIDVLFTSEPTSRSRTVNGCLVLGRYSIGSATASETVADLARGFPICTGKQWLAWNTKKIAKVVGGRCYFGVRSYLLSRRQNG